MLPVCLKVPAVWYTSTWSGCNPSCGPGTQVRTVECRRSGAKIADSECSSAGVKPETSQACNLQPCNFGSSADRTGCTSNSSCYHGNCVDGVCCNVGCGDACTSCAVYGHSGVCWPLSAGVADAMCTSTTVCGYDGKCNGDGTCRYISASTPCSSSSSCTNGVTTGPSYCDGHGSCVALVKDCSPYLCGTGACRTECSLDNDCTTGYFCSGSVCRIKKIDGQQCGLGNECSSGYCSTQGVCCESSCTGACSTCNSPSSPGKCLPLDNGVVPRDPSYCSVGGVCGQTGVCNGNGGCAYRGEDILCGNSSCIDSTMSFYVCGGSGTCSSSYRIVPCDPYACGYTSCWTSCSTNAECSSSAHCDNGQCVFDNVLPSIMSTDTRYGPTTGGSSINIRLSSPGIPMSETVRCRFYSTNNYYDVASSSAYPVSATQWGCATPAWSLSTVNAYVTPEQDQLEVTVRLGALNMVTANSAVFTYYRNPSIIGMY